jgi:signal transduction histidine kinase
MKYLILLFLFFSNLYSHFLLDDFISEDNLTFKKASFSEYKNKELKEFTIKFKVNLGKLKNETHYLAIVSNKDSLVHTNTQYEIINNVMLIKLDDKQKNELIFQYKYETPKRAEFRWNTITDFEYTYLLKYEGILYGVSYGIIFCAFLYYLIIYFSSKIKHFLYYSLMQLFVLFSLIGFVYFSYQPYPASTPQAIVDICETLSFLFTLLFAQSILYTKQKMPKIHIFINLFILLNILDVIAILFYKYSILYEYLSFYVVFLIPFFTGILAFLKGNKYSLIYTLGWLVVCIFTYVAQNWEISPISSIYVIHIGAPLESLIFSFALGYMLKTLVNEKNEKEKLLIHQSKLASMGEMINNIAHQWRQPLTHLGFINMNLQLCLEEEPIDKKYINEKIEESNAQLDFMSKTIDNFRDFYKINKKKELFYISDAVKKALDIMEPIFKNNKIEFEFNLIKDKQVDGYENEYSQVILNILTNAKDVLLSRQIQNPKIVISINQKHNSTITTILDNAGGIENKYINQIFDPYFTTKEKGSGIGLYMSEMIIKNHFKGKITACNKANGSIFSIEF